MNDEETKDLFDGEFMTDEMLDIEESE